MGPGWAAHSTLSMKVVLANSSNNRRGSWKVPAQREAPWLWQLGVWAQVAGDFGDDCLSR